MTFRPRFVPLVMLLALGSPALQGCTAPGVIAGTAATVGVPATQERSIGAAVDDTIITAVVGHPLFQKDIELFRAVNVEVVEGRVLLLGSVNDPEDRVEAVRLAWQAEGVKEVINEIQVTDRGGIVDFARDTWISAQLKTKLLLDREIKAINYNVETVNGVVYMIGIAQDQAELERVTNHARTIKHVRKVISHVRLKDAAAS